MGTCPYCAKDDGGNLTRHLSFSHPLEIISRVLDGVLLVAAAIVGVALVGFGASLLFEAATGCEDIICIVGPYLLYGTAAVLFIVAIPFLLFATVAVVRIVRDQAKR